MLTSHTHPSATLSSALELLHKCIPSGAYGSQAYLAPRATLLQHLHLLLKALLRTSSHTVVLLESNIATLC